MTFFSKKKPSLHVVFNLLIFLCFTCYAYAQDSNFHIPDSLKNKSPKELAQSIKSANLGEAIFYENVVLKRLEKNNTAIVYQELGRRFSKEENYKKAHQYLDIALEKSKASNDTKSACVVTIIKAKAYVLDGENQQAINFYDKAIIIAQEYEYKRLEIIATSTYMILLSQIEGQLDRALDLSSDLLDVLDRSPEKNTKTHVQILTSVNDVFLESEQYDKVISYVDKGIQIADSLGYKKGLTDLYIKKGIALYYKQASKESQHFLIKAKNLIEKNALENDFHQKVRVHYFLAKHHYDENLYDEAIHYLTEIINNIKDEDTNKLPVIQSYRLLANCHRKKGDNDKAWHYNEEYIELKETYQKNENKTSNRIFERESNTLEIEVQKERQRANLEQKYKRYTQIGLLIVFVLLIVVVFNFFQKQKKNKTLFNNLIDQIDELESQHKHKEFQEKKKIVTGISIDDDKVNAVLKGLAKLEKQEYFLRSDCNLRAIAKKTKTNATYLSKIINTHKDKNFNEYMNDLRIDYALRRLKHDKRFRSFSVKSIAEEIGYKSDKSFTKHFKSKTGINPSYYIKNLEKLEKDAIINH